MFLTLATFAFWILLFLIAALFFFTLTMTFVTPFYKKVVSNFPTLHVLYVFMLYICVAPHSFRRMVSEGWSQMIYGHIGPNVKSEDAAAVQAWDITPSVEIESISIVNAQGNSLLEIVDVDEILVSDLLQEMILYPECVTLVKYAISRAGNPALPPSMDHTDFYFLSMGEMAIRMMLMSNDKVIEKLGGKDAKMSSLIEYQAKNTTPPYNRPISLSVSGPDSENIKISDPTQRSLFGHMGPQGTICGDGVLLCQSSSDIFTGMQSIDPEFAAFKDRVVTIEGTFEDTELHF